ncbi:MAG: transposase [Proteobacteria bacterium]|nr:transposase [Pseudomonadota bacterium]MBW3617580.1 transposase [Pseudomonadota bacterium]
MGPKTGFRWQRGWVQPLRWVGESGGWRVLAEGRAVGGGCSCCCRTSLAPGPATRLLPTPAQAADCKAAEQLLAALPSRCIVHADRSYDSNRIRGPIEDRNAVPHIPPEADRLWKSCFGAASTRAATPPNACSAVSRTAVA